VAAFKRFVVVVAVEVVAAAEVVEAVAEVVEPRRKPQLHLQLKHWMLRWILI